MFFCVQRLLHVLLNVDVSEGVFFSLFRNVVVANLVFVNEVFRYLYH